jgi:hypothetical protein
MDHFLDFLNSADSSDLIKLSGIDSTMAEKIISARPFESDDDVLKVSGLGEKSLENLKAAFDKLDQIVIVGNQTPARVQEKSTNATITIKTEAPPEKEEKKESKGFGYYAKRFFQGLFIFLLIVVIVGGFGYALYQGIPYFINNIMTPIQENTNKISFMTTQQAQDLIALEDEISTMQTQIDGLQNQNDSNELNINSLNNNLSTLATAQMSVGYSVATLEVNLGDQLTTQQQTIMADIEYNLKVSQSIQLLSRANLYLSQSNYGLARQDISAAYGILDDYLPQAPAEKQEFLGNVMDRLEMSIYNLPNYPVVAANDLQIAWQYLLDNNNPSEPANIPMITVPLTYTPTPYETLEPSYTPTPYETITPTVVE